VQFGTALIYTRLERRPKNLVDSARLLAVYLNLLLARAGRQELWNLNSHSGRSCDVSIAAQHTIEGETTSDLFHLVEAANLA
jgi:hypothetical protein